MKKNQIQCKTFTWTCAIFQNQLLLSIVLCVNFKTVFNLFAYENEGDERKKASNSSDGSMYETASDDFFFH